MIVDTVLLKVASRCNLDCSYCYVYHSPDQGWRGQPARMSWATIDAAIARLGELQDRQGRALAVVLHGGEPLLLRKPRLEHLLRGLRKELGAQATIALQTNATLLSDDIIEVFAQTRTAVAVSIDGPREVNDRFRRDHRERSSFSGTLDAIRRLNEHPQSDEFFKGTLSVVNPATNPKQVYEFLKTTGVSSIDFLYQDGNHDRLPHGKHSAESVEYGEWMARLWRCYVDDAGPIAIECLDNATRGLMGRATTKEGSGTTSYGILIVETDGTIAKNDTLKSSFDGADRFARSWSIHNDSLLAVAESEEFNDYISSQTPSHRACRTCSFLQACGGGMVLHRWSSKSGYDNPSIFCADQKHLYRNILHTIGAL